jgi:hypothetical protein
MAGAEDFVEDEAKNGTTIFGLTVVSIWLSEPPSIDGREEIQFCYPALKIYRKIIVAYKKLSGIRRMPEYSAILSGTGKMFQSGRRV